MQSCSDVGIGTKEDENVKMRLIEPHADVKKKKPEHLIYKPFEESTASLTLSM